MITDSFDNFSEEIIKVYKNENAKKVDACILDYNPDDDYYSQVISIYSDLQTHLNLKHINFYYIDKGQQKIKKRNAKG